MSSSVPASPTFYRPAEVAKLLRCSEWWIKEQARKRRIPFCWIGGSYRFTDEHLAEIARLFEVRPTDAAIAAPIVGRTARQATGQEGEPVVRLSARIPRRARSAASDAAA